MARIPYRGPSPNVVDLRGLPAFTPNVNPNAYNYDRVLAEQMLYKKHLERYAMDRPNIAKYLSKLQMNIDEMMDMRRRMDPTVR